MNERDIRVIDIPARGAMPKDSRASITIELVHPETEAARQAIRAVIEKYRKAFDQESVLRETSQVCAAF